MLLSGRISIIVRRCKDLFLFTRSHIKIVRQYLLLFTIDTISLRLSAIISQYFMVIRFLRIYNSWIKNIGSLLAISPILVRAHPTLSETKYVINNQITDNVDIYHSQATMLRQERMHRDVYEEQKAKHYKCSFVISDPRYYIQTFTILIIQTIELHNAIQNKTLP